MTRDIEENDHHSYSEAATPDPVATSEQAFLEAYDPSVFDRPAVTVDTALLSVRDGELVTLLSRRGTHPFRGYWALPGGFVGMSESLEDAAARILQLKGRVSRVFLEQLYTFGRPDRDPRARIITVAYFALVPAHQLAAATLEQGPELVVSRLEVPWEGEAGGPVRARSPQGELLPLAFDHAEILGIVVSRLRGKLSYTSIGFELLPDRFTLHQLREIHEVILGRPLNKDSFRRRMLAVGDLEPTGERQSGVGHRPAELYRVLRPAR